MVLRDRRFRRQPRKSLSDLGFDQVRKFRSGLAIGTVKCRLWTSTLGYI